MRYAFLAATMALSAAAFPTAAPAKFAIQITADIHGKSTTLFLGKSLGTFATGVEKKEDAAACSLSADKLICEGKVMGAQPIGNVSSMDMAPIAPATKTVAISDGFTIDEKNQLHFRSPKFETNLEKKVWKVVKEQQGGEAGWGLFSVGNNLGLFVELGCHGMEEGKTAMEVKGGKVSGEATHKGLHQPLFVGTNVVVPL